MQLDSPSLFDVLLFESPWAVMIVCLVAALILFMSGQRRQKTGLLIAGFVAVAIAGGVYLLSNLVTTDREQLMTNTRNLVQATAPLDSAVLNRLVDLNAVVTGPNGGVWVNAGDVLPRLNSVANRRAIASQSIRYLDAIAHEGNWGESVVTVHTEAGTGSGQVNTGWRLRWERNGDDGAWRVVDIRWMRFNGVETPQSILP